MIPTKRIFDIALAAVLACLLAVPLALLCLLLLAVEGRPIFYVSERMKAPGLPFRLIKLRTMRPSDENGGVTGGDKDDRIGRIHKVLRKTRLDEVPQIWNVLTGDMSFVGPRPPLRVYVDAYPGLYNEVLKARPGITGLATLVFHAREAELLRDCTSAQATDDVYRRRCIPVKARLDLIYLEHRSVCFDAVLLWRTIVRVFTGSK